MVELETALMPPRDAATYDDYLGRFVDAVQTGDADVQELRLLWIEDCPDPWRDKFSDDVSEIESLLAAGAMARVDAA